MDATTLNLLNRVVTASFRRLGSSLSRLRAARSYGRGSDPESIIGALSLTGILDGLASSSLVRLQVYRSSLV